MLCLWLGVRIANGTKTLAHIIVCWIAHIGTDYHLRMKTIFAVSEKGKTMKKGTILRNLWAGYETYFIYMGFPAHGYKAEAKKTRGYSLVNVCGEWRFESATYYVNHLKDTKHFPVVGWIDFNQMAINGILRAIESGERKDDE